MIHERFAMIAERIREVRDALRFGVRGDVLHE
jgi:hypothetical protein